MQEKNRKKQYRKIFLTIIVIIYVSVLVIVAYKYVSANRYWEIDGFDTSITTDAGQNIQVKAKVKNKMYYVMSSKDNYFISYHLYSESGSLIEFENPRINIEDIEPGWADDVEIQIKAPSEKGKYKIVIDIVKEGEYWFEARGDKPGILELIVNKN